MRLLRQTTILRCKSGHSAGVAQGNDYRHGAAARHRSAGRAGSVECADGRCSGLKRQQSLTLADYLNNNFSGINVSESQDNPFQPDVNYHGFTASPLLGTPEGLSVFVDGVRVNEAFGDTVNWDLIPGDRDLQRHPDFRLQPGVRSEYSGRCPGGADQERPRFPRY